MNTSHVLFVVVASATGLLTDRLDLRVDDPALIPSRSLDLGTTDRIGALNIVGAPDAPICVTRTYQHGGADRREALVMVPTSITSDDADNVTPARTDWYDGTPDGVDVRTAGTRGKTVDPFAAANVAGPYKIHRVAGIVGDGLPAFATWIRGPYAAFNGADGSSLSNVQIASIAGKLGVLGDNPDLDLAVIMLGGSHGEADAAKADKGRNGK